MPLLRSRPVGWITDTGGVKITAVRVFRVEGGTRSGEALYEIRRGGLEPDEATPYRATFTLVGAEL